MSVAQTPSPDALAKPSKKRGRPRSRETKFSKWIDARRGGDRKVVATALEAEISYLNSILRGTRTPSTKLALKIVDMSGGELTLEDLLDPAKRFSNFESTLP